MASKGRPPKKKSISLRAERDPWGSLPVIERMDKWTWLVLALAIAGVVAIYGRALGYGFTAWDDPGYVTDNAQLGPLSADQVHTEFTRNVMGNYHPLTMLSYALDITLAGGKSAHMMHITALLLHVVNILLVFVLVRSLWGYAQRSAWVALLFAWHPMRVESVAWISDRKDLLMLFFAALCLIAYLKFLRQRSWMWSAGALLGFSLACLSKATAVALVPTLLLIDVCMHRPLGRVRVWLEKVPFAAVGLLIGVVTVPAQQGGISFGAVLDIPLGQRVMLALANVPIYLAQLFVPIGTSSFYGYANAGHAVPEGYAAVALLLIPMGWALYRWRSSTYFIFGALFFVINIALLLQFTSVGQAMRADRYTYLPSIGWAMLAVMLFNWIAERAKNAKLAAGMVLGYALLLAAISFTRVPVWKDEMSVWNDMIAHDPQCHLAYACRSGVNYRTGDFAKCLNDAETALRIDPKESLARYNRGLALMKFDRYDEAVKDLLPFAGIPGGDLDLYESLVFGTMHIGRCDLAIVFSDTVLRRVPTDVDIMNKRGYCLAKLGRLDEARVMLDRSAAIKNDYAEVWYMRAFVDMSSGDTLGACESWKRSLAWPLKDEVANKARAHQIERFCK